jgi:hypothetical protein
VVLAFFSGTHVAARATGKDGAVNDGWTYGSGNFGSWYIDGFDLPAFTYDVDERVDPRAAQPELAGGTEAQHQLGNDHIVAAAFNHGYTQLWSQDRLSQWANFYEPATRHWAGGFGYLLLDGTVTSTLALDRGEGTLLRRDFGVGYFGKTLATGGVVVEELVYAPFGDDPLLLDDVTIANQTDSPQTVSWFEYWDVNPRDQTAQLHRGVGQPVWNPGTQTLSVAQSGGHLDDPAPLSIFAAVVQGPVDAFETSLTSFFGDGTRAAPAEVTADRLSGTLAPPSAPGVPGDTLFVFRAPLVLAPRQSVKLRYAYGIAHADQIDALVAKYRAAPDPLGDSLRAWVGALPKADFGRHRRWVARELVWDAYLLRSASVYEELCGHHTITQGGYYQYWSGYNLGFRSWPHYLLPITYMEPELAREILRYTIGLQPQVGNRFAYGTGPMCRLFELGTSGDLDFWLLLAAAEYGLGARDRAFFQEPIPFYDTRAPATAWEHVKLAYRHQETLRGPHGAYAAGTNGDWSDFSAPVLGMSDSTLVGLQLAYAYPKLAELADRLGDEVFASEVRARAAELRRVLRGEWTGRGWYPRGYGGDRQIGQGAIFGEPQPWAILAGIPTPRRARRLVANIRRFLDGVDAPEIVRGPTRIGSSLTPAHDDPDVTERSAAPVGVGDNNANYVGGVWFDVNGWLTWALGELDGVVPHARRLAWSEYTRNTLANHATQFPDHWAGTISIDDTCYAYYSSHPERCGNDLYRQYDGQITEQPTWMVMDAIRLAGITPTATGYRIAPHLPFVRFSLQLPYIGVSRSARGLRGYVRPQETDTIELRVRLPRGVDGIAARASGRAVAHRQAGRFVVFRVKATAGAAADWAVTWGESG